MKMSCLDFIKAASKEPFKRSEQYLALIDNELGRQSRRPIPSDPKHMTYHTMTETR